MANIQFLTKIFYNGTRKAFLLVMAAFLFAAAPSPAHAGLVYAKPALRGKVLEKGTRIPMEGVVVVARYSIYHPGVGAGGYPETLHVRETVTDANGEFAFPEYFEFISPLVWSNDVDLIFFKSGYTSIPSSSFEDCFIEKPTCKEDESPKKFELERLIKTEASYKIGPGYVELGKLHNVDDKLQDSRIEYVIEDMHITAPILYKAISVEQHRLLQEKEIITKKEQFNQIMPPSIPPSTFKVR